MRNICMRNHLNSGQLLNFEIEPELPFFFELSYPFIDEGGVKKAYPKPKASHRFDNGQKTSQVARASDSGGSQTLEKSTQILCLPGGRRPTVKVGGHGGCTQALPCLHGDASSAGGARRVVEHGERNGGTGGATLCAACGGDFLAARTYGRALGLGSPRARSGPRGLHGLWQPRELCSQWVRPCIAGALLALGLLGVGADAAGRRRCRR
jgi:hypothetical protein